MSHAIMVPKPKHFQNYEHETIDDYDINEKIREDNNTVLFIGRNLTSHNYVTIKAFHILKTHPKNIADIVRKEFDTLKEIKHENLAPLLGFFYNAESVFVVTPFFPDGDMQKFIMESGGRSEAEAAEIFQQIVSAVAVLHAHGIAHGDLRMSNIAITKYPNVCVTGNQFSAGTGVNRLYASPEAICRIRHDEKCADVWALGIILFVLVTGRHPFNDKTHTALSTRILHGFYTVPDTLSSECKDLLMNTLAIRPQARLTAKQILSHPWFTAAKGYNTYKGDATVPARQAASSRGTRNFAATAPQNFRPIQTAMTTGRIVATMRRRPSHQIQPIVLKIKAQDLF